MTCETATLLIHFARPGDAADLAAVDHAALDSHLANCPHCSTLIAKHRAEDAAIGAAMKAVPMPIGLRDALQTQAIATRNAIWRTLWIRRASGLAAVIVLAIVAVGAAGNLSRPTLDSDALLWNFESGATGGPQAFEDWRAAEGLPELPQDFDLQLMTFTGRLPVQGREAPAIRLTAGPGQEAVIYFLRNSRFDLRHVGELSGSNGTIRKYDRDGWTILVLHSGHSLQPFLRRPGSSA